MLMPIDNCVIGCKVFGKLSKDLTTYSGKSPLCANSEENVLICDCVGNLPVKRNQNIDSGNISDFGSVDSCFDFGKAA
ncbi:hypothetical protein WICPIJ_008256 [Wickerhamomyces pijperi]|uniref:Uncharacterized protein n=1 Tax=Wickerhamomyces pijperi TaxID=599730 RepID=A0A9P8Q0C9_WICPI|nr:hypothetical protein WICPIJ_008256 [Wickerhamomyces pijperi]